MYYIELPSGAKVRQNDEKHYGFTYESKFYLFETILKGAKEGVFRDEENHLSLQVSSKIPVEDKCYAEYLPNNGQPSRWCEVVNGKKKTEQNTLFQEVQSWTKTDRYKTLSDTRKAEVDEARREQKEDRYQKGPKSI